MCPVKVWKIPLSVASALQTLAEARAVRKRRIVRAIIAGLVPILRVYHGGVSVPDNNHDRAVFDGNMTCCSPI
jgi:hypothetical protein